MSNLSAINFFSENIGITGFDHENAPFMTFKELFDNSIDACLKKTKTEWEDIPKKIRVCVNFENLDSDEEAKINVIVSDTGCGIPLESIDLLGTLFGTNKKLNRRDSYYTGQFGVGLKMILLYVAQNSDEDIKVKMRMGNKIWKFKLLCNLKNGTFYVGNSESHEYDDWEWVTEFSVSFKIGTNIEFIQEKYFSMELYSEACINKIQSYLALAKLWNYDIHINFETNLRREILYWPDGNIEISFQELFKEKYLKISSSKSSKYKIEIVLGFSEHNSNKFLLDENENEEEKYEQKQYEEQFGKYNETELLDVSKSGALKPGLIHLYRFSNDMPIISKDTDSCDIVTSVKSFIRKKGFNFGMKVTNKNNYEDKMKYSNELSVFKDSEYIIPVLLVPSAKYALRTLFINVRGHGIQYGTLGKSSLRSNVGLSVLIQQTLRALIKNAQSQFPNEFMNIKDFNLKNSIEIYSPIIAKNLASMVVRSDSLVFKNGLYEIFSKCDQENSFKYSKLLEGKDEEKLKEVFCESLTKWFSRRCINSVIEDKTNMKEFCFDSEDNNVENEFYEKEMEQENIIINGSYYI
ncbi:hypothetical protein FG379_002732 [Cryptosporidium bovis]|uniref:uncharacterized protein n=1 Tax=Cryptosporidium bovis TaxID=310047 RepID=UPI003519E1D5|nr:hypothetical protein FG379_002732 [Cryptosporidium bovis]